MSGFFGSNNQTTLGALRVEVRPLMRMVYLWMTLGLIITAVISIGVSSTPALLEFALTPGVMFGAIIGELILVVVLSMALRRLSPGVAAIMFFVYAVLNGFTLSIIFLVYSLGTIGLAFF